jgi:transposase InsO family protein
VLDQPRSTQRYAPREPDRDRPLVRRMLELVRRHPRYGYRRITALLRQDGWVVNRKRIHRLWRQAGLKVPQKQRKRRRLGHSANGILRRRPEYPNHVWCYDFLKDQTTDGRPLKLLPIEDEYTRECLTLDVARSITAQDVIRTLGRLFAERGAPRFLRSDNGPEFIAQALRAWLPRCGVQTLYIAPGAPWENAYSESFHSRLRDELLDRELFTSVLEARVLMEDYRQEYNQRRPHSALGYVPPAAFAARCRAAGCAPQRRAPLRPPPSPTGIMDPTLIATGT